MQRTSNGTGSVWAGLGSVTWLPSLAFTHARTPPLHTSAPPFLQLHSFPVLYVSCRAGPQDRRSFGGRPVEHSGGRTKPWDYLLPNPAAFPGLPFKRNWDIRNWNKTRLWAGPITGTEFYPGYLPPQAAHQETMQPHLGVTPQTTFFPGLPTRPTLGLRLVHYSN